jgi:hypothetical protein
MQDSVKSIIYILNYNNIKYELCDRDSSISIKDNHLENILIFHSTWNINSIDWKPLYYFLLEDLKK